MNCYPLEKVFCSTLSKSGLSSETVIWSDEAEMNEEEKFFDKFMALVISKKPNFNLEQFVSKLKPFKRQGDEKDPNPLV